MIFTLSFSDLLLIGASTILLLTIILLVKRINSQNYVFVITLSLYFTMIIGTCICILFLHFKQSNSNTTIIPVIFAFVLSAHNVFHYLNLQHLILKTNLFRLKNLIHFAPIFTIVSLMLIFNPVFSNKGENVISVFENQNLIYNNSNNYFVGVYRILHPTIYLILGGKLIYSLYKNTTVTPGTKSIRWFIFFIYFQKIILMFWFLVGLVGFKYNFELFSNIAITAYSISAFLTSTYVLLNPDLSILITKLKLNNTENPILIPIVNSKTAEQLHSLIKTEKLYLKLNYNLTNLSSDAYISTTNIRKIINAHGFKNYSSYMNSFRVDHAKELIQNGYLKTFSIDSLCKVSGFQSEATFYRVFKKIQKCTPIEYGNIYETCSKETV